MSDDPLFDLERGIRRLKPWVERSGWETANRLGLLWVHALVGIIGGIQMALYGSAPTIEVVAGTGSRYVLAGLAFAGGCFLAAGLTKKPRRSIPLEVVGLTLIALWDLCMTVGLAYARLHQDKWDLILPGQPLPEGYASAYPITVYGGLLVLVLVHLYTLRYIRRIK